MYVVGLLAGSAAITLAAIALGAPLRGCMDHRHVMRKPPAEGESAGPIEAPIYIGSTPFKSKKNRSSMPTRSLSAWRSR